MKAAVWSVPGSAALGPLYVCMSLSVRNFVVVLYCGYHLMKIGIFVNCCRLNTLLFNGLKTVCCTLWPAANLHFHHTSYVWHNRIIFTLGFCLWKHNILLPAWWRHSLLVFGVHCVLVLSLRVLRWVVSREMSHLGGGWPVLPITKAPAPAVCPWQQTLQHYVL